MKKIFVFCVFVFVFLSCKDDFDAWGYVNFYIEPDTTEYYNLNIGNRGWEYLHGGYNGVVVCRLSYNEFKAYERSCTTKGCKGVLEVDQTNNVLIFCPECKSQYLCVDGSPLENSSAHRMLYEYCSSYDGLRLYVHNCNY